MAPLMSAGTSLGALSEAVCNALIMSLVWVSVSVDPGDSPMLIAVLTSRQNSALAPLGSAVLVVVGEVLVVVDVVVVDVVVVEAASSLLEFEQPETRRRLAQTARNNPAGA